MINDYTFDSVLPNLIATSADQAYRKIADFAGRKTGIRPPLIYKRLAVQEKRSTSGIGKGVALPHLRLKGLEQPFLLFARLARMIDFKAVDRHPVDVICLLLSPHEDTGAHLQRLSRLTRMVKDDTFLGQVRDTRDKDTLHAILYASRQRLLAA